MDEMREMIKSKKPKQVYDTLTNKHNELSGPSNLQMVHIILYIVLYCVYNTQIVCDFNLLNSAKWFYAQDICTRTFNITFYI